MAKKFFGDNVNAIKNIQQTPLEKAAETKKVQNETAEIEQETIQTTLKTTESVKTDATLKVQPKINLASILKINGNDSDDKKQNQKIKNEKLSLEDLKSEEASDNTLTKIRPFANEITSIKAGGLKQSIGLEIGSQNANSNNSPVKNEPTSSDETITIEEINIKNDPTNSRETIAARKETVSSFAHSLKKQIEEYKPPIMKVSLSLNPKNLGQVDVTIKQRGSKIEVNLTSNNHALQIFTNGSYDLKSALASLGYNAINMNLNDSSSQQEGRRDQGGHEKEQEEEKDELNITMEEETN